MSNTKFFLLLLAIFSLSACNYVSEQSVDKVNLYQDGTLTYTFTKKSHTEEIGVLVEAVNKVKKQSGVVDMPQHDYLMKFVMSNSQEESFSVWVNKDQVLIMRNSSHYVQLSSSKSEKVAKVITDFETSTSSQVNLTYIPLAILGFIVLLIIIGVIRD